METQKNICIKSNHGNHSGFNRKWEVLGKSENIEELKTILMENALRCSDDITTNENGEAIDLSRNEEILYNGVDDSFNYDGRIYVIVTESEFFADFFNGGSFGYASREISEYFESGE